MIPRNLAACPTLERYRTLSHNTLEELGLPRCPLRGHSRPNWAVRAMSGLPPIATEYRTSLEVRFVPGPDSCTATSDADGSGLSHE